MNFILKSILQFTLVAALFIVMLLCWCWGVKYYYDKQLQTEIKIREINGK